MMKVDILAIGAHPDDIELSCAGTILKHIASGYSVGILDLTRGELGTRGTPEIRDKEAATAAKILGVSFRKNLEMADGFFVNDQDHQRQIIRHIRASKPEIILCNAVSDRHPDHGRAASLVSESCFYSGLRKIETEFDGSPQEPWRPKAVYHYLQDRYIKPDLLIDITAFMPRKLEAIRAFSSQFYDPSSSEPLTPISSKQFLDFIVSRNAHNGRDIQVDYAEAFTVERTIGVDSFFDLV
jgi:bacillithiol biosynthesis deacetylase BshB1